MDTSNFQPLLSSPSSEYELHNVMVGRMLSHMGLYSAMPSGSLSSLTAVEQQIEHENRRAQTFPGKGAVADSLQEEYGSPRDDTNSVLSQSPPRAELGSCTGTKTGRKIKGKRLLSNTKGRKGMKTELSRIEKKRYMNVLERNRQAVAKCRARKQFQQDTLSAQLEELQGRHKELSASCSELKGIGFQLKSELFRHGDCDCTPIQLYIANEAVKSVDSLILNSSPSNSFNSWVTSAARPEQDQ
ncbi:transcription factor atf1 [Fusarium beomiforme]|uniref:Transcription factor atf1 n=1 Tax=Fusarium beomiforme TaxID=44412 RepID=A0A9P5A7T1_9HYPO|nr:transcription factor atf1 [Fusarium beomiforme]